MSESSRASPRATDPKIRTLLAPNDSTISTMSGRRDRNASSVGRIVCGVTTKSNWNIRGPDFSQSFVLSARIEVAGAGFVGNEALRFQATVGCAP